MLRRHYFSRSLLEDVIDLHIIFFTLASLLFIYIFIYDEPISPFKNSFGVYFVTLSIVLNALFPLSVVVQVHCL